MPSRELPLRIDDMLTEITVILGKIKPYAVTSQLEMQRIPLI